MARIKARVVSTGTSVLPGPSFVELRLTEFSKDEADHILLSPHMVTSKEVDEQVDHLIDQLEKARRAAKKLLSESKIKKR
jgi:hypothetical protein